MKVRPTIIAIAVTIAIATAVALTTPTARASAREAPTAAVAPGWARVMAGGGVTCAIKTDRSAWCWGLNNRGQVGVGSLASAVHTPTELPGTWLDLTQPGDQVCGVRTDHTGWCWGSNSAGELGVGDFLDRRVPTQVPGLWSTFVISFENTCGIHTDGTAACWGRNRYGQVGDGTQQPRNAPVALRGIWLSIGQSRDHTCGIRPDASSVTPGGTTWCWGRNEVGQLGIGTTTTQRRPVRLAGNGWTVIQPGNAGACGLRRDGSMWCWGDNSRGQIGDGTTLTRLVPTQVPGSWMFVAHASFGTNTCGVRTDGALACWGDDVLGQLGTGGVDHRPHPSPVLVDAPSGTSWTAVQPMAYAICGLDTAAQLLCWGSNRDGRSGTAQRGVPIVPVPTQVALAGVTRFSTNDRGGCAITTGRDLWCWGLNTWGQVGDGTVIDRFHPRRIVG